MMFNWVKTAMLMAAIMALFGIVGGMIGGKSGMLLALLFGGAMNLFSYCFRQHGFKLTTPSLLNTARRSSTP